MSSPDPRSDEQIEQIARKIIHAVRESRGDQPEDGILSRASALPDSEERRVDAAVNGLLKRDD